MTPIRIPHVVTAVALACHCLGVQAQQVPASALVDIQASASITTITVASDAKQPVADGRSKVEFQVQAQDAAGMPVKSARLQLTVRGALVLQDDGTASAQVRDLELKDGSARFTLLAPPTPGPVYIAVQSAAVKAEAQVHFAPDPRDMVAIGVVEGVLSFKQSQIGSIRPTSFNDGFEQEIVSWSHALGGDTTASARTAFFLKGKIDGNALLTAAYDSDKPTRLLLSQLVDPNQVYPVYGDGSITQLEAQSKDRLFVRLDKDKHFVLYGDFSTLGSNPVSQSLTGQGKARQVESVVLGKYVRNATGLRGHYETDELTSDAFLTSDSLTNVSEEFPANGTSGPYAVSNSSAVQNSETVQVVVRDRAQLGLVKSLTPLVRYQDYTFEPFSGRILLNTPLSSVTPGGDPQYLRISYEVDQGGPAFLTYGVSASLKTGEQSRLGGVAVQDDNPLSPYRLTSANTQIGLGNRLRLSVEAAQSQATRYQSNGFFYANPTGQAGETGDSAVGNASRLELSYQDQGLNAQMWWLQADAAFYNVSSGVAPGKREMGVQAQNSLNENTDVYAQYTASANVLTSGDRRDAKIGVLQKLNPALTLDVSVRTIGDNLAMPQEAQIAPNAPSPAGTATSSGGFFGTGTGNTSVDPLTGATLSNLAPTGAVATPLLTHALSATTARIGLSWKPSDDLLASTGYEAAVDGASYYRADAGVLYSLNDKDRVFARVESQSGLASPTSLNAADRSNVLSAGVLHALSEQTTAFSEYRLVDAYSDTNASSSDQMLVNGLQNRSTVADGLQVTSSAEYLSVLSGSRQEAAALTGGLDYTGSKVWRASNKLEYRRVFDDTTLAGDQSRDQILSTILYARKLDSDWTLLLKNYYLYQHNRDDAAGRPIGNARQERFITGFAWRPTSHNQFNALARYEYKVVDDGSQALGERYDANIFSVNMEYKPSRSWWANTRLAWKSSSDYTVVSPDQTFNAALWSGRVTVDVTDKWDVGALVSTLQQADGKAGQDARGLEAGYQVHKNAWISVGYNWMGYFDRDLTGTDYTQQGPYVRLRAKFDELSF